MSNELYRAERCRDLAEEYRRIAAMCTSTEMRSHYSRMSEHYRTLAKTEEFGVETSGPPDFDRWRRRLLAGRAVGLGLLGHWK